MNILVNGIGNIGTTLLGLLVKYKTELGINNLYALKNNLKPWQQDDIAYLESQGIKVVSKDGKHFPNVQTVKNDIQYIFDTTSNGGGMQNKPDYEHYPNLIGASAQGSEKLFGTSFMSGINNEIIAEAKYAHIVSCNTHSLAALLTTFTGGNLEKLRDADFVIVRRSEDLGNHERLVTANVVARHLDTVLGTHHSIDVIDLFKTKSISLNVTSSDVTTPSQLMHGVRFNITLDRTLSQTEINECIEQQPLVSSSIKFDSNIIFERGRRFSFQGRIYSHAVIIGNNIISQNNQLKGWAFIPQEGNTIISTIHAFLLQTKNEKESQIMQLLSDELIMKKW